MNLTNPNPRSSFLRLITIAVLISAPSILAAQGTAGGSPAPATETPDLAIYRLSPTAGDAVAIREALTAADHELDHLKRANDVRRGPPREDGQARIMELNVLRQAVGDNFTKTGWNELVRGIFLAMATDRVAATQFDDESLWNLSRNPAFLEAGQVTVVNLCAPCHLATLRGSGAGTDAFGPDLTDTTWLHGSKPTQILDFITHGAFTKGMPPWGSIIGAKKVAEVAAVVLSKHEIGMTAGPVTEEAQESLAVSE